MILPLLHEHRILAQVAGYHSELIKFLPPINIAEEDLEYFLCHAKSAGWSAERPRQRLE